MELSHDRAPTPTLCDGDDGKQDQPDHHEEGLEGVGEAHGKEAAHYGVAEYDGSRHQNPGPLAHPEAGGHGFPASNELGRHVNHHKYQDDDGEGQS